MQALSGWILCSENQKQQAKDQLHSLCRGAIPRVALEVIFAG